MKLKQFLQNVGSCVSGNTMSKAIGRTLLGLMVLLFASHLGYAQNAEWLRVHNKYRCIHGVPPVKWSTTVAKSAQDYANICSNGHSGSQYGENIAWASNIMSPTAVVSSLWYSNEAPMYNYNNPIWSPDYGHFTQLVWKNTAEIGCGFRSGCPVGFPNIWVCHYNPPGNMIGQFATNVLRPIRTEAACAVGVEYHAHVQDIGWQPWVSNGATAGTTGQSRRMEAVQIQLLNTNAPVAYNVQYRAHVQDIGWQPWVSNGATAGTTGQSRRLEALEIYVYPK